ncbi:MAG TPA: glyoxalase/bleomycin resistance/extradiol dioxygenase family protein [Polyangiales bacterium]|nr:glyoxalase/bleomycin resistance/extradiol dioxygenase family protein [Polyangiales bacterium]
MLNAYLNFPGSCEQAIAFYAKVFRGEIESSHKHGETPMKDHVSAAWRDKIIHTTLRIGDGVLMASDAPPEMYKPPQGFAVSITLDVSEAERVFPLLGEGGTITMPLQETFWAQRFGAITDRYGIPWMITGGHQPKI